MNNFKNFKKIRDGLQENITDGGSFDGSKPAELNAAQSERLNFLKQVRSGQVDVGKYQNLSFVAAQALRDSKPANGSFFKTSKIVMAGCAVLFLMLAGTMSAAATDSLPSSFQSHLANILKNVGIQLPQPPTQPTVPVNPSNTTLVNPSTTRGKGLCSVSPQQSRPSRPCKSQSSNSNKANSGSNNTSTSKGQNSNNSSNGSPGSGTRPSSNSGSQTSGSTSSLTCMTLPSNSKNSGSVVPPTNANSNATCGSH